jgi:hypothetical protein
MVAMVNAAKALVTALIITAHYSNYPAAAPAAHGDNGY